MCAISSLTSTFAISSPDEFLLLLYTNCCTRHNYRTTSMHCRAYRFPYNQSCSCQLDRNYDQPTSTTTSVVDDTYITPPVHHHGCEPTRRMDTGFKQHKWPPRCHIRCPTSLQLQLCLSCTVSEILPVISQNLEVTWPWTVNTSLSGVIYQACTSTLCQLVHDIWSA